MMSLERYSFYLLAIHHWWPSLIFVLLNLSNLKKMTRDFLFYFLVFCQNRFQLQSFFVHCRFLKCFFTATFFFFLAVSESKWWPKVDRPTDLVFCCIHFLLVSGFFPVFFILFFFGSQACGTSFIQRATV